jgi:hypothetical protein
MNPKLLPLRISFMKTYSVQCTILTLHMPSHLIFTADFIGYSYYSWFIDEGTETARARLMTLDFSFWTSALNSQPCSSIPQECHVAIKMEINSERSVIISQFAFCHLYWKIQYRSIYQRMKESMEELMGRADTLPQRDHLLSPCDVMWGCYEALLPGMSNPHPVKPSLWASGLPISPCIEGQIKLYQEEANRQIQNRFPPIGKLTSKRSLGGTRSSHSRLKVRRKLNQVQHRALVSIWIQTRQWGKKAFGK